MQIIEFGGKQIIVREIESFWEWTRPIEGAPGVPCIVVKTKSGNIYREEFKDMKFGKGILTPEEARVLRWADFATTMRQFPELVPR